MTVLSPIDKASCPETPFAKIIPSVTSYPSPSYDFLQVDSSTKGTKTLWKTSDIYPQIYEGLYVLRYLKGHQIISWRVHKILSEKKSASHFRQGFALNIVNITLEFNGKQKKIVRNFFEHFGILVIAISRYMIPDLSESTSPIFFCTHSRHKRYFERIKNHQITN